MVRLRSQEPRRSAEKGSTDGRTDGGSRGSADGFMAFQSLDRAIKFSNFGGAKYYLWLLRHNGLLSFEYRGHTL